MNRKKSIGEKPLSGILATCSGVAATTADQIQLWAEKESPIAIFTTKSVSSEQRAGNREPIFIQTAPGEYVNAVGLTNPGAQEIARQLNDVYPLPNGKFLMASIVCGDGREEDTAQVLSPYADGIELNLSCPHTEGLGTEVLVNVDETVRIVREVQSATKKPVFAKLSPNYPSLEEVVKASIIAGIDGFTVVNTYIDRAKDLSETAFRHPHTGTPVLSNVFGGESGHGLREHGKRVLREVYGIVRAMGREKQIFIIAEGGVSLAQHAKEYLDLGADAIGVGSAITGMNTKRTFEYFRALGRDLEVLLESGTNLEMAARILPEDVRMDYSPFRINEVEYHGKDIAVIRFDDAIQATPGQYVFTWIPRGTRTKESPGGEKPFSVADYDPLTLVVRNVGPFTGMLYESAKGEEIMIRGPYGNGFTVRDAPAILVGGGTGMAPMHFLTKYLRNCRVFFGAAEEDDFFFLDSMAAREVYPIPVADNGEKGRVLQILRDFLEDDKPSPETQFYICGPEPMMAEAIKIAGQYVPLGQIQVSIERIMKCGVGICGSCSLDGYRTCVDGPVMDGESLANSEQFGRVQHNWVGALDTI